MPSKNTSGPGGLTLNERLGSFVVYADHCQFIVGDQDGDTYDYGIGTIGPTDMKQGWSRRHDALWVRTQHYLWQHRVDVFLTPACADDGSAERVVKASIEVARGRVAVFDGMSNAYGSVVVPPGRYTVFVRAFNLGQGPTPAVPDMAAIKREIRRRDDLERYEVVLVPRPRSLATRSVPAFSGRKQA